MARSGSSRGFPCQIPGRAGQLDADACRSRLPWSVVAESGVAESAPCPSIAAGFCGQAAGGEFLVAGVVQRVGLVTFLGGGDLAAWRDGGGRRGGSQAYLGPRARAAPGDKMIDWVSSRRRGDAAAQSVQAVRLALRGRAGSG